MLNTPEDCKELEDELIIISYLFSKEIQDENKFKEILTRCLKKKSVKIINKRKSLHSSQSNNTKILTSLLKNKELLDFELLSSNFGINQIGASLKQIDSLPDGVTKEIFQMYVYAMMGNTGKVNEIIRQALNRHFSYRYFNFQKSFEIDKGKLDSTLYYLLSKINEKTSNKELLKLYLRHQSQSNAFKYDFEILSRFDLLLSIDQLNDITRSPLYAYRYPALWYPQIFEKKGANKAMAFLEKSYPIWEDNIRGNLWLYGNVRPKNEKRRKIVIKEITSSFKSQNLWDKEVKFLLLEDIDFKLFYEKYSKNKEKPLFVQRKIFYQSQLKSGQGFEYSLYQLLRIGAMPLKLIMSND